jgi:glucosyl-3-phosphoglycerate phosphatase
MTRLILVRHGESIYNAEARIQGQRCEGLSELGHAQAKVTASLLSAARPDTSLVTSDLQRTRETMAPLADALGRTPVEDPRLRERSFGRWEGHLRVEVERDDADRWNRWIGGEDVIGEVGGETRDELAARVVPAFLELLADDAATTVAVTHGGPIWHGLHRLLGLAVPTLGGVRNCSITELRSRPDGGVLLVRWNETGHLPIELHEVLPQRASNTAPPVGHPP